MISAKVLVVEDERVVAMHLKQQLSRLGYEVPAMATRGEQALAHISTHRPDIVLMDIHIEGDMDGIETASRIPTDSQTAVIYLTAYSEESTLDRARHTNPHGYLLKPFSERELHAALQMVMQRRQKELQTEHHTQRLETLVEAKTDLLAVATHNLARETKERRNAEQAFQQAQKMEAMGQLTGGVAHDFNNIMQVVSGNLGLLARNPLEETPRNRRLIDGALKGSQRATTLTQRLLAFARRQPLQPRPTDVNALLNDVAEILKRAVGEATTFDLALDSAVGTVSVDPNQLESVLLNLAINARDAMPQGGTFRIETRAANIERDHLEDTGLTAPGCYVMICVTDTGTGMNATTLAHAFEPFFTTKGVGAGSGLGLSQVYGFLKQSGGGVALTSEMGKGTTVKLYLPQTGTAQAIAAAVAIAPANVGLPGRETILVVEDDPDVRLLTVDVLRELGYTVLEAADGPSALTILEQHALGIDLLFTDVVLPGGMNGVEIATSATLLCPHLKVLLTTGYSRNAIASQSGEDALDVITKPFSFDQLALKMRDVLERQRADWPVS